MKEKIINLKNKIVSFFINLKNKIVPFILSNKKIAIIVLIALVVLIIAITIFCNKTKIGNTNGNLNNLGFSVKNGSWVYYLGFDEGKSDGIYKVSR